MVIEFSTTTKRNVLCVRMKRAGDALCHLAKKRSTDKTFCQLANVLMLKIISFVLDKKEYHVEDCMKLKQVCKFFNKILEDEMFGSILHVYTQSLRGLEKRNVSQRFWQLPYAKVDKMNLCCPEIYQLRQSGIRNCRVMALCINVSKSTERLISLDFFQRVDHLFLFLTDYYPYMQRSDSKEERKVVIQLPVKVRILFIDAHLCNKVSPTSYLEGGYGIEELHLCTDQSIVRNEYMWSKFLKAHQQTLRTLVLKQGEHPFTDMLNLLILQECQIEHLKLGFQRVSTYTFDISKLSFLQTLHLECIEADKNVQLFLTHDQKQSIKFDCQCFHTFIIVNKDTE